MMKHWILVAIILLFVQDVNAWKGGDSSTRSQKEAEYSSKKKCTKSCASSSECSPVCFERGYPTNECCSSSAYSEPAAFDVNCGWNAFVTASFIYWQAIQGGMDLALPAQVDSLVPLGTVTHSATGKDVLYQDFKYKPGFQVGLGWVGGKDMWMFFAEYTWLHASTTTTATAPAPGVSAINGVPVGQFGIWMPTDWLTGGVHQNRDTPRLSSRWEYDLDILDAEVSRPFYSGMNLILDPFFGLRALWFSQDLDLTALVVSQAEVTPSGPERVAKYRSRSWGVGPRAGLNGKWHFSWGFRMIGDTSVSLLFTRYTKITQDVESPDANDLPVRTTIDDFDALRPNLDLSWGIGWGSYFCCRRFHWDLALTYDFSIFWEQNMMRYLADLIASPQALTDGAASNFYLHGLTFKTAFEF